MEPGRRYAVLGQEGGDRAVVCRVAVAKVGRIPHNGGPLPGCNRSENNGLSRICYHDRREGA